MSDRMGASLVVPTIGRTSLAALLASLDRCTGPRPEGIVLADDRRDSNGTLPTTTGWTSSMVRVVRTGGRGPAAARNAGWRSVRSPWVVFIDDDVVVTEHWLADLHEDLRTATAVGAVGSQARLSVPVAADRRPTDWERGTAGLAQARWITADMAYRRDTLAQLAGFDERFRRAFREDADLALRITAGGARIVTGSREAVHPVRPARWTASISAQRGNADDALMRELHGRDWYERAGESRGRRPLHFVATSAMVGAVATTVARSPRLATAGALLSAGLIGEFAWRRIARGPRTIREVGTMLVTSAAIPPLATLHWLRGRWRHRGSAAWPVPLRAVLVDRDGTLIRDVPYNGDPSLVEPQSGVEKGLARLRDAGLKIGVVSNQSGIARGLVTAQQVEAVNARIEQLLGRFDTWQVCPHAPDAACRCRKPLPGLLAAAAEAMGVQPYECAIIGDIGADVEAGHAAGTALAVLVPTAQTLQAERALADEVCEDFDAAAQSVLERSRS